jgi:hypothetical protein
MRRSSPLLAVALTFAAGAALPAQDLARRVSQAGPDQDVAFEFPSRPDVCGYRDAIIRFNEDGGRGYSIMQYRGDSRDIQEIPRDQLRSLCQFGPVRVLLRREDGEVKDADVNIGGSAPAAASNLGAVTTSEASTYIAGLARTASRHVANQVLSALHFADGEYWPPLLELARDRSVGTEVRKTAIFWLGQAAAEKATAGLHGILGDSSEELDIRKQALFALSQQRSEVAVTALIDVAQTSREPELRRTALFWLGQNHDDPRVLALFEKILLGR